MNELKNNGGCGKLMFFWISVRKIEFKEELEQI